MLLAGSYNRKGSLFLVRPGQSRCEELTPADADCRTPRTFRVFGRRHMLDLATDEALYAVDLAAV